MDHKEYTEVGTDINEVKKKNAESGLSYNEVKALLAQTGGKDTSQYSDTDVEEIRSRIHGQDIQS
ncbi:gamma-type small acid-soluble spore protein [Robertmurraya sp. FSL R5-0851]|uniref:gamma-type small acid-soluble spore protein n=1 Tax=Robertmurraya sp. FSL R5-0851 TaxID=2921584 RepID=UPI0030F5AD9F